MYSVMFSTRRLALLEKDGRPEAATTQPSGRSAQSAASTSEVCHSVTAGARRVAFFRTFSCVRKMAWRGVPSVFSSSSVAVKTTLSPASSKATFA